MRPITPQNNKGIWCLTRFVPQRYKAVDARKIVRINTGIRVADDPAGIRAYEAVQALNAELEAYWRGLAEGRPTAPVTSENAREYAARLGLRYQPVSASAAGPVDEILRRLSLLESRGLVDEPKAVAAILGGASRGKVALSGLVKAFEAEEAVTLAAYSPNQLRRWRNTRNLAVKNLMSVIERDAYIDELTRDDALDFRDWWKERIINEGVDVDTANKQIGHISAMIEGIAKANRLEIDLVFKGLRIDGGGYNQRQPYTPEFVQNHILAESALAGLNPEARRVVYVCAEIGLRPVEVVNMTENSIKLECDVPHVIIQPEGRVLKTPYSERHIPLVGVALKAMRLQPKGFPKYFDKSAALSACVNKYMKANKLRPETRLTLYSLRHTFEDRLTTVEPPEKIQAYLMGHKYDRPKYGSPPSLEQLQVWLNKIAFRAPTSI